MIPHTSDYGELPGRASDNSQEVSILMMYCKTSKIQTQARSFLQSANIYQILIETWLCRQRLKLRYIFVFKKKSCRIKFKISATKHETRRKK